MRTLIFILMLGCAACTSQAQGPGKKDGVPAAASAGPDASPGAGGDTLARIRAMASDTTCVESGQCRTLPLGALACGGPQDYLPYSTIRTDEKALRELGERYKNERMAENKASGIMSTCRYVPDPGAVCTSGTCQLGASSPAAR